MDDVAIGWCLVAWRRGIRRSYLCLGASRNSVAWGAIRWGILVGAAIGIWLCISRIIVGRVGVVVGLICVHDDLLRLLIVMFWGKLEDMSAM